jgi:hypothetical protein
LLQSADGLIGAGNEIDGKGAIYKAAATPATPSTAPPCSITRGLRPELAHYGDPGPGKWVTIYANPEQVFMGVASLRFDTRNDPSGVSGPRWRMAGSEVGILAEFAVQRPVDLWPTPPRAERCRAVSALDLYLCWSYGPVLARLLTGSSRSTSQAQGHRDRRDVADRSPVCRVPTIEERGSFIAPTFQARIDVAEYVDDRLHQIFDEPRPTSNSRTTSSPSRPPHIRDPLGPDRSCNSGRDEGPPDPAPLLRPADYPRARPLGPHWHNLQASVRTTDSAWNVPGAMRDSQDPLMYLSIGSLGSATSS